MDHENWKMENKYLNWYENVKIENEKHVNSFLLFSDQFQMKDLVNFMKIENDLYIYLF